MVGQGEKAEAPVEVQLENRGAPQGLSKKLISLAGKLVKKTNAQSDESRAAGAGPEYGANHGETEGSVR